LNVSEFAMRARLSAATIVGGTLTSVLSTWSPVSTAQTALPQVEVTVASPIRRPPPKPRPAPAAPARTTQGPAQPAQTPPPATTTAQPGVLPVVTDQFATVTVVPGEEIRRSGAATLGDLLLNKPGITGSSFAPGASSRPIIRGLDVNRVGIVENGTAAGGASDLGEDHFVPIDPLTSQQVEVIRGPATLRYGSQSIGGVVSASNNRIPETLPPCALAALATPAFPTKAAPVAAAPGDKGCVNGELRGGYTSVDNGRDGALLLDGAYGRWAVHVDAFGRTADDYRIPSYPYLVPPDPADAPRATQPGQFNGRQPNSALRMDGQSAGASYVFNEGFVGVAVTQNNAVYHIPGIDGEDHNTRIDAHQTKLTSKGEYRPQASGIDTVRFWFGATDYRHEEIGLADDTDPGSDGVRQIFTNREQEARSEVTLLPFDLRFAQLTTAIGVQAGHQKLTAPSPDGFGLWDPNTNTREAAYTFNEFRFTPTTKAQLAARIEHVDLQGFGRSFDNTVGFLGSTPASPSYTPKSASIGLIQDLPWDLVASVTGQYVERAPKPAELFSGGGHDATATFDKGNPGLGIEAASSIEAGLRRAAGPFRFEATAYYTRFKGFIFRHLTGDTCDDSGVCGPGLGELREAIYSQRDAIFRGAEFQSQLDVLPLWHGWWGIENQFDVVRATFTDGTNVPRIPPMRVGGGLFYRDDAWLAKVNLLHAFAQNDIALIGETPTPGYNDLRAEVSYRWVPAMRRPGELTEVTVGLRGTNLLNVDMRNSVSYTKDEVLLPGASVRAFANVKF
jgi:iron complex outermembrane receptor protein